MTDELDDIIKELETEQPKEDEKAKPEKKKYQVWEEEESESNISQKDYEESQDKNIREKHGI